MEFKIVKIADDNYEITDGQTVLVKENRPIKQYGKFIFKAGHGTFSQETIYIVQNNKLIKTEYSIMAEREGFYYLSKKSFIYNYLLIHQKYSNVKTYHSQKYLVVLQFSFYVFQILGFLKE